MAESKVLHLRGLPEECTQADIKALVGTYAPVVKLLHLVRKGQAFVEFASVEDAAAVLEATVERPIRMGSRNVIAQFSNKTEIEDPEPKHNKPRHEDAVDNAIEGEGRIILVTVLNVVHPVNVDVMSQVFTQCGTIEKIVVFQKGGKTHALVMFSHQMSAASAIQKFHGKDIYSGCNQLNIAYSNLSDLTVKANNDTSYDFTNDSLPAQSEREARMGGGRGGGNVLGRAPARGGVLGQMGRMGGGAVGGLPMGIGINMGMSMGGMGGSPVVLVSNLDPEEATADALFNLFSTCGNVLRIKILYTKRDSAFVQYESGEQAENARVCLHQCPLWRKMLSVSISKNYSVQGKRGDAEENEEEGHLFGEYSASNLHRYRGPNVKGVLSISPAALVHVAGIPGSMTQATLHELFARHGPVSKSKFLTPKLAEGAEPPANPRKMALVQLPSPQDAAEAICELHNTVVDGCRLRISFSNSILNN